MKKDLFILLLLIFPAFAILMQKGYFSMHDDLQSMRQFQMDKCFSDGQIPCRWTPDLGYGYGYPLFNYYPPLPYLIGQPFRWIGFQYIDIVKIVGVLGFVFTAFNMYLLGREFWGRGGGLISSAFYTYAPYHSVDYYVRGAINEFWAMAFYPLIFFLTYKLIQSPSRKYIPLVAVSVAGLMLSHNPMLMIFAPVYLLWIILWWWCYKSIKSLIYLIPAALLAFGLAAFFTLPVLFETKFVSVWTLTSGYFNYLAHFLDIRQIFLNINWGYGSSELGPNDSMSFALGHLHWLVPLIILIFMHRKSLVVFLIVVILGSLFMAHSRATPIWLVIRPLEFLQFPWRFLTLAVFAASFLSGGLNLLFPKNSLPAKALAAAGFALLLYLNGNYFRPREWYSDMTDQKKFSGKSWQLLVTSGIFDYLPKGAPQPPADPRGNELDIISGSGIYTPHLFRSNRQEYRISMGEPGSVELQTYDFPGWKYYLDSKEIVGYKLDPLLGRPQFEVPTGTHDLVAILTNTPIRSVGNLLSAISWAILVAIITIWTQRLILGMWTSRQSKRDLLQE